MIRFVLRFTPRWFSVICLALLALIILPSTVHAAATTDAINMFKYTYGIERLIYLAIQEIVAWRIFSKRKSPMGGRGQWIVPIQTANTGVWVGHTEGGAKTTRRAQPTTTEATFFMQEFHGIWDVSWKMLQDAMKDEYAFERAADFLDESFRRRTFRLLNADIIGTGRGELASLPAADNGDATFVVSSLPLADQGMIVDLIDASDDSTAVGVTAQAVSSINVQTRTIVTAGGAGAGTAAGDYFTVADSIRTLARSNHTFGLRAWLDTVNPSFIILGSSSGNTGGGLANLGGIDRSTAANIFWTGNKLSNSGTLRPLTEDLMMQLIDLIRERGGRVITDWMSNLAIIRRYHESLRADVFFALTSIKELGDKIGLGRTESQMQSGENSEGETPYQFSGIPWRAEAFFAANALAGFNRECFYIGHGDNEVPRPIAEIFGEDMVSFFARTANTTFEVDSYWQGQLLCDNPPAGGIIYDVAES